MAANKGALLILASYCVRSSDFQPLMHLDALPTIMRNYVCDFTTPLLPEVCHNVDIEHYLQPLTGENLKFKNFKVASCDNDAHLNVHALSKIDRSIITMTETHIKTRASQPIIYGG